MQFVSKIAETESWKFSANSASLHLCVKNQCDGNGVKAILAATLAIECLLFNKSAENIHPYPGKTAIMQVDAVPAKKMSENR